MAINPNEYTISYSQLLRSTTIRDRVNMAQSDNTFYSQLAQALTPTQMANLFPRYYRDRLPDISGFNLATEQIAAGTFGKGLPTSVATGEASTSIVSSREKKTKKQIEDDASKTGEVNKERIDAWLEENGIDVKTIYNLIKQGTNLNDPRLRGLKDLSQAELKKIGVELYQDERGKNLVRTTDLPIEKMSDKQLKEEMRKSSYGSRAGLSEKSALIDFKSKKLKEALGIDDRQYNAYRQGIANKESRGGTYNILRGGTSGKYTGAYQFGDDAMIDAARILGMKVPTKEEFSKNPELQELFMDAFTYANHKTLMQNSAYKNMSPEEKLGMLAYAHQQGGGGGLEYLKNGIPKVDGFGIPGTAFIESVQQQLETTKDQKVFDPNKEYTAEEIEKYKEEQIAAYEKQKMQELTDMYVEQGMSEKDAVDTAEKVVISSTSSLGFALGEEETYLGGISRISEIPTSGGTVGSREFGKVYTDPKTGKQYSIRGGGGHAGTDFGAEQGFKTGTPWKAHMGGSVIGGGYSVGKSGRGYGYYIDVKFDDGSIHRYAHNDENVAKGKFEKGKTLFKVGATGVQSGWAHAHAEVWLPKKINGKQYTADELYKMSAAAGGSKTERGLLYRSNPRDYWQGYEQQQLALREKYTALQERVENDPKVLDSISNEELILLAEKGQGLYPQLSEAAKNKVSGINIEKTTSEEVSVPELSIGDTGEDAAEDKSTETAYPYADKSFFELQKMFSDVESRGINLKDGSEESYANQRESGAIQYAMSQITTKALEKELEKLNENATGKDIPTILDLETELYYRKKEEEEEARREKTETSSQGKLFEDRVPQDESTFEPGVDNKNSSVGINDPANNKTELIKVGLAEGGIINAKDNLKVVREDGSPTGIRVASDETAVIIPPDERRKARDIVSLDGTDQRTGFDSMDEEVSKTNPIEAPLNQAKMSSGAYQNSNQSTIPSSLGAIDYSPSALRAFARDKYVDNHGFHSAPRTIYAQK